MKNLFTLAPHASAGEHKGHEVHKGGLSDDCGSLSQTFTKDGRKEVITLRHALNLRDLCVLRV